MPKGNEAAATESQGNATEQTEAQRPDPFAGLPTVQLAEATVLDLSSLETSAPRKYTKVNEAAIGAKMPIMSGWKHSRAMFVPGNVTKEHRAGSVFGTIVDIAKRAGKAGISSYEMATELRRAQIGNKRSHYCEKLPPVGWAEGYLNSAVTQGLIGVHATKQAPALAVAAAESAGKDAGDGAKSTGTNG